MVDLIKDLVKLRVIPRVRDADVAELLGRLLDVAATTREQIAEVLAESRLTKPHATMIWLLDPDADAASMRDLARRLRCDPSNMTLMVTKLEPNGLAVRRPHPAGRRIRVVIRTDHGRQVRIRLLDRLTEGTPLRHLDAGERNQGPTLLDKISGPHRPADLRPANSGT